MTSDLHSHDPDRRTGGVTAGDVIGGIRGSIIAGRDVILGSTAEQRAQRNRRAMLELVRNTWVRGVLEQSLHGAAMIELGMEERAGVVERPWDMVLHVPERPNRRLPSGTQIRDVFDAQNRALLILGEPGSGKTTTLLELARDTIARAEEDPTQPIPVVFNLSSWAERRQPIAEWLVEELNAKYQIPRRVARPWVENDDLLLLLDGLDEVRAEYREACTEAINGFRQEHGLAPIAVCSRTADYEALATRLRLQGAVLLRPLTPEQIDQYLAGAESEAMAVSRTFRHDAALQELAQSPLMLSVMALAYGELPVEATPVSEPERRRRLFDAYVDRMLEQRGAGKRYPSQQAVHWLAWLARQMSRRAQAEFFLEGLQPSWLPSRSQRRLYNVGIRLIGAAAFVLAYAVGSVLACALTGETVGVVLVGLAFGLAAGLAFVLPSVLPAGLPDGVAVALAAGLMAVLVGVFLGSGGGLIAGLLFGLPAGLAGLGVAHEDRIEIAEMVSWSWTRAILGGVVGLAAGLAGGLILERVVGQVVSLADELAFGLPVGLAFMLALGLSRSEAVERRTRPNQGIRRSARNAIWVGVTALLASVLFGVPIGVLEGALSNGLAFGLFIGLPIGLTAGLAVGGCACIQHSLLRFILYRGGHIPWDLADFLDCATDCVFLRKVGGGYIFVHRLLLEHFAALES